MPPTLVLPGRGLREEGRGGEKRFAFRASALLSLPSFFFFFFLGGGVRSRGGGWRHGGMGERRRATMTEHPRKRRHFFDRDVALETKEARYFLTPIVFSHGKDMWRMAKDCEGVEMLKIALW